MSLQFRRGFAPPELAQDTELGGGPHEDQPQTADPGNILVTSGIHRGRFPIGGMRVRAARDVLRRLITIEEEAVAVVNGRVVDDDEVISENVTHVAFVKPSAIKGRRAAVTGGRR
jgi:hypothetical protein